MILTNSSVAHIDGTFISDPSTEPSTPDGGSPRGDGQFVPLEEQLNVCKVVCAEAPAARRISRHERIRMPARSARAERAASETVRKFAVCAGLRARRTIDRSLGNDDAGPLLPPHARP